MWSDWRRSMFAWYYGKIAYSRLRGSRVRRDEWESTNVQLNVKIAGVTNHVSLKKRYELKNRRVYTNITHSSRFKAWTIFSSTLYEGFFCSSWHFKREKSMYLMISFCKTRDDHIYDVYNTLRVVRISLLISYKLVTKGLTPFSRERKSEG